MSGSGQRATYRYVVTMSDMPLTTDIGGMPIGLFRWQGGTVRRCRGVVVSRVTGSVTQADGDTRTARQRATVLPEIGIAMRREP